MENEWYLPWDDNHVLLELPIRMRGQLGNINPAMEIKRMQDYGFIPVIAHPERYTYLSQWDLDAFCDQGALLQVNYPSLHGKYGEDIQQRAMQLVEEGKATYYGTDLHSREFAKFLNSYFV